MKYVVKVNTKGSKTATYMKKDGTLAYITLKTGRNILDQGDWERIKDTPFMKNKLRFDEVTFSEMEEEAPVLDAKIDLVKASEFVGKDDGKDLLAEYAAKFGYKLKKNKNIDNMLKDLIAEVQGE